MSGRSFTATVDLAVPTEELFRYLADPVNRPEWQSSLMSVRLIDRGEPRVGMRWRDSTVVGVKPHLEITELQPYRVWTEVGRWAGVTALLRMRFTTITGGTRVQIEGEISGTGAFRVAAALGGRLAPRAIVHDLERAADVLRRGRSPRAGERP